MKHPAALEEGMGVWVVLQTRARQEKALASTLAAMDVPYFLPLVKKARYYGRRKSSAITPLFPNYIFMRGAKDIVYRADRTKRVAQIISVPDQDRLHRELNSINLAVEQEAPLDPFPYLKKGIRVEVRSGPFQGMEGLIEDKTKDDRLIVQIDVLGQATSLEIDGALLEAID